MRAYEVRYITEHEPKILQWTLEIMLVTGLIWGVSELSDYVAQKEKQ